MEDENTCSMLIKQIHSILEREGNNSLRENGLTLSQMEVLRRLNNCLLKQTSLKEMERMMHVAQSTAAGIVSRLEKKGFIVSFGDASDKRVKMIKITPLGEKYCEGAKQHMCKTEKNLFSALTQTEQEILKTLLKKIRDGIQ